MKISYRNYPVLIKLQNHHFEEMELSPLDQTYFESDKWVRIHDIFKHNAKHFLHEVIILNENFANSSKKASNRLLDLYRKMIFSKGSEINFNGTFIEPGGFTYLLRYNYNEKTDHSMQLLYWFEKDKLVGSFYLNDFHEESGLWICENYNKTFNLDNVRKQHHEVSNIIGRLLVIQLFKECAKVETKKLPPKSVTIVVEMKYVNETRLEITLLDSLWFNTLVNSDRFNDHGHFNVKTYGKELKDYDLKWIREVKPEYTPPARILKYFKINGGK
jgi:hypothetical protein